MDKLSEKEVTNFLKLNTELLEQEDIDELYARYSYTFRNDLTEYLMLCGINVIDYFDTKIPAYSFDNLVLPEIKHIQLKGTINEIEENAFTYSAVEDVNLENIENIYNGAFFSTNLKSINCSKATYIGENAFRGCSKLKDVTFDSKVHLESRAFAECVALQNVVFHDRFRLGEACFTSCSSLRNVDLSNITGTIKEKTFYSCLLDTVIIGEHCTCIEDSAFTSVKTVTILGNETEVERKAFVLSSPCTIRCKKDSAAYNRISSFNNNYITLEEI